MKARTFSEWLAAVGRMKDFYCPQCGAENPVATDARAACEKWIRDNRQCGLWQEYQFQLHDDLTQVAKWTQQNTWSD